MKSAIERALNGLTRVRGVRGALAVSRDDGLVVADALMEGVSGPAVAALTASLTKRLGRATEAAGVGAPQFVHLQSSEGAVLAVPARHDVILVAVADPNVNAGLIRLEMLRAAEAV